VQPDHRKRQPTAIDLRFVLMILDRQQLERVGDEIKKIAYRRCRFAAPTG
jgi:phosphate uptake regulator